MKEGLRSALYLLQLAAVFYIIKHFMSSVFNNNYNEAIELIGYLIVLAFLAWMIEPFIEFLNIK